MNDIARQFLQTYAQGGVVDGGWMFPSALKQARLDFSDESLDRLDQFFARVRELAKPTAEMLQNTTQGRNGCALIAYYVIELARRRSGATMIWHDRASAVLELPATAQLPDTPSARIVALAPDQGAAFMPLGWVEAQALGLGEPCSANAYLTGVISELKRAGPAEWLEGMEALGRLASWQMMAAAGGTVVMPTMLHASQPRQIVALKGADADAISVSVNLGATLLDTNPGREIWQVFSYDGYLDSEHGRSDAVMVALYTYGPTPLRVKIAFPYCPAKDGRPFAILQPTLRNANVENEQLTSLNAAMERGIQSVVWPSGVSWDGLRDIGAGGQIGGAGKHHVPQQPARQELEEIITSLRGSFARQQRRMNEVSLRSLIVPAPRWMQPSDALNEVFARQRVLLTEGHIVWGALVQANTLLFQPGQSDHPALLVHSDDRYFDARPAELRLIGRSFFALKGTSPSDPELGRLARLVTDEVDRSMRFELPRVFSERQLHSGVFMVFRSHIPNGVLSCGLFPILTHPSTPAVMMVPFEFWPAQLTILWREGRL